MESIERARAHFCVTAQRHSWSAWLIVRCAGQTGRVKVRAYNPQSISYGNNKKPNLDVSNLDSRVYFSPKDKERGKLFICAFIINAHARLARPETFGIGQNSFRARSFISTGLNDGGHNSERRASRRARKRTCKRLTAEYNFGYLLFLLLFLYCRARA